MGLRVCVLEVIRGAEGHFTDEHQAVVLGGASFAIGLSLVETVSKVDALAEQKGGVRNVLGGDKESFLQDALEISDPRTMEEQHSVFQIGLVEILGVGAAADSENAFKLFDTVFFGIFDVGADHFKLIGLNVSDFLD